MSKLLFPTTASVKVVIEIDGHGVRGFKQVIRLDATNLCEHINCQNQNCRGGGFSLGAILRDMVGKNETYRADHPQCRGYEGVRRTQGLDCTTGFKYTVDIVYK